jgi:hypothetical protein
VASAHVSNQARAAGALPLVHVSVFRSVKMLCSPFETLLRDIEILFSRFEMLSRFSEML